LGQSRVLQIFPIYRAMSLSSRAWLFSLSFVLCGCNLARWNPFASEQTKRGYTLIDCPEIPDVASEPLGESDFNGPSEQLKTGSFNDTILHDKESKIKIAARQEWNGTLVFFGDTPTGNTLDDSDPTRGVQLIFHDQSRPGWEARQSDNNPAKSRLRILQTVRFVKSHILQVEALITNLSDEPLSAHHEFPALSASRGLNGSRQLSTLKNADGDIDSEGRLPAATGKPLLDSIRAPGGWATFQSADGSNGIGIYWENRNYSVHLERNSKELNSLRSDFNFTIPPHESVRGRFYLLLGGYERIRQLVEDLDHTLPAFGRIEEQKIDEDARNVSLAGWVLDNKGIDSLELWVDGKKLKDLQLNQAREDICAQNPGYKMCLEGHAKIGFTTTYARPLGQGCRLPVEVRARDSDGNWRTIARQGILPLHQ
jgi:hypothetical protein